MCFAGEVMSEVVACDGFKKRFGSLAGHPYNRDKPDQTVWWLFSRSRVPWGNWPASPLAKYFIDRPPGRGVMRVGLGVEKGISKEAVKKGFGPGQVKFLGLTPEWAWHGFVEDLKSGRLLETVAEVARRAEAPVEVTLETSTPTNKGPIRAKRGVHRFEVGKDGSLESLEERPEPAQLVGVGSVKSLKEMGLRLDRATEEETWTYIDAFVSVSVPHHSEPPADAGPAWTGADFWKRAMEPFADWVA